MRSAAIKTGSRIEFFVRLDHYAEGAPNVRVAECDANKTAIMAGDENLIFHAVPSDVFQRAYTLESDDRIIMEGDESHSFIPGEIYRYAIAIEEADDTSVLYSLLDKTGNPLDGKRVFLSRNIFQSKFLIEYAPPPLPDHLDQSPDFRGFRAAS